MGAPPDIIAFHVGIVVRDLHSAERHRTSKSAPAWPRFLSQNCIAIDVG
jgi:hypothetical protein